MAARARHQNSGTSIYPDMQGKVALVTGGSSGIGLAAAAAFARQGLRVVIASRREATARTALKQLSTAGDVQWHPVDTADGKSVARLIEAIMGIHGRLDYAFNNGGSGGRPAPVASMSEHAWRRTIDGYLTSVFLCLSAEIAVMKNPSGCVHHCQQRFSRRAAGLSVPRRCSLLGRQARKSSASPVVLHWNMPSTVLASVRSARGGSTHRRWRVG